jgi:hypothetical protein
MNEIRLLTQYKIRLLAQLPFCITFFFFSPALAIMGVWENGRMALSLQKAQAINLGRMLHH